MWIYPSPDCDVPNFSSILFNSPITTFGDNHFSILASSMSLGSRDPPNLSKSPSLSVTPHPTIANDSTNYAEVNSTVSSLDSLHTDLDSSKATSSHHKPIQIPKRKPKPNNLKIAIINCQSVRNTVPELETLLETSQPDVVIGTESWLTDDVGTAEIFPSDYTRYRRDRKGKKKGG